MNAMPRGPLLELASMLARGYLRLLAARSREVPNSEDWKPNESLRRRQNCLDVSAQQRMNCVGKKIDGTTRAN